MNKKNLKKRFFKKQGLFGTFFAILDEKWRQDVLQAGNRAKITNIVMEIVESI